MIPGNDDSSRAIRLYARGIADAVLEGRTQSLEEVVAASRDEFVEVEGSGEASTERAAFATAVRRKGASRPFFQP